MSVVTDTTEWRKRLGMPVTIREARQRRTELAERLMVLREEAARELRDFHGTFPSGLSVYLARSPDKSYTPLRWRLGAASGPFARRRVDLASAEARELLVRHTAAVKERVLEYDFRRFHLNYAITATAYELERLEAFIRQYEEWRRAKNDLMGDRSDEEL